MPKTNVIIIGAAGRDFHNFNVLFRNDNNYNVVAFTASQIPFITKRRYPESLSGRQYKNGIPIFDEAILPSLITKYKAGLCVQAYSDLSYLDVMHKSSIANAGGADFLLVAPQRTMIKAKKPVIAVCATRTGSGKSQTTRYIALLMRRRGLRVAIIRHPMPYGHLEKQAVEKFGRISDLEKYKCTIEEREEYESHIRNGFTVYAGVDYQKITELAQKESDIIIWDGGNNDLPFIKPDMLIVVADPFRGSSITSYYPSETVARMADVVIINKVNTAASREVDQTVDIVKQLNSSAKIIYADSVVSAEDGHMIKSKRVLIVEDGPTITHGGMRFGAGSVAAQLYGASAIVSAKRYAVGSIRQAFERYQHLGRELPAMGYSDKQIKDLRQTINNADCDIVISATPVNLGSLIKINKPVVTVSYELVPKSKALDNLIDGFVRG